MKLCVPLVYGPYWATHCRIRGKKLTCLCPQGVYRTAGEKYRLTSHSITEKCEVEENFPSDGQPRVWLCCCLKGRRKSSCGETVPASEWSIGPWMTDLGAGGNGGGSQEAQPLATGFFCGVEIQHRLVHEQHIEAWPF